MQRVISFVADLTRVARELKSLASALTDLPGSLTLLVLAAFGLIVVLSSVAH